jgi:hypothetical protein
MTNSKKSAIDPLLIDVVEYAFTEWLVRRKIFSAFKSNYRRVSSPTSSFRSALREHIEYVLCRPSLGVESLISSAFFFDSTSEGHKFWLDHSDAWRRFYNNF